MGGRGMKNPLYCEYYEPWCRLSNGEELEDACVNRNTRTIKRCDKCREEGGDQ